MKKITMIIGFLVVGITTFAQNTKIDVDVESLQKEMEEQFKKLPQDVSKAMEQFRIQMDNMQLNTGDNSNEIIINGDTIVIQNGEIFGIDMGDMFQKLPEGMEQLDFFFKPDGEMQQLLDMFEHFNLGEFHDLEHLPSIPSPQDIQPKKHQRRRNKDEKGREIYSL